MKKKHGNYDKIKHWLKELKKYCEYYNEWPKALSDKKVPNGKKTSNQLYSWLYNIVYNKYYSKYRNAIINGKSLIEIVNELFQKYGKTKENVQEDNIKEWINELINYCEKKQELPTFESDEIASGGTKTSNQLYGWLYSTGYYSDDFKYNDVKIDGKLLFDIIKEICSKYKKPQRGKIKRVTIWIRELENYCIQTNEWPIAGSTRIASFGTKTSHLIYNWLYTSGYTSHNFKYKDVIIDGKSALDIIDELYEKYNNIYYKFNLYKKDFDEVSMFENIKNDAINKEGKYAGKIY